MCGQCGKAHILRRDPPHHSTICFCDLLCQALEALLFRQISLCDFWGFQPHIQINRVFLGVGWSDRKIALFTVIQSSGWQTPSTAEGINLPFMHPCTWYKRYPLANIWVGNTSSRKVRLNQVRIDFFYQVKHQLGEWQKLFQHPGHHTWPSKSSRSKEGVFVDTTGLWNPINQVVSSKILPSSQI